MNFVPMDEEYMMINFPLERSEVVELLKHYDITPTRQRIEIASFLFQRKQHLSADKILDSVNADSSRVSRATVYNTMGLFANKGLVREVLIDRERTFYDSNNQPHHHMYNVDTGTLSDISGGNIEVNGIPELGSNLHVIETDVIVRVSSR